MTPDFAALEQAFLQQRGNPPDMPGTVAAALAALPADAALRQAGDAIAQAVQRHGAGFPPGCEPAYHNRHHQAETVAAMAVLAQLAGLPADQAALAILAMAGHDLLHDGRTDHHPGLLERRSADASLAILHRHGLPPASLRRIEQVILATEVGPDVPAPTDPLCRLAREADLCASLMPGLGWQLSDALGVEHRAAGLRRDPAVDSFAGRHRLLLGLPPFTPAAEALGMAASCRAQLAAFARLGADAAAMLDALPKAEAMQRYQRALQAGG